MNSAQISFNSASSTVSSPSSSRRSSISEASLEKTAALGKMVMSLKPAEEPKKIHSYVALLKLDDGCLYSLTLNVPVVGDEDPKTLNQTLESYEKEFVADLKSRLPKEFHMEVGEELSVKFLDEGYDIHGPKNQIEARGDQAIFLSYAMQNIESVFSPTPKSAALFSPKSSRTNKGQGAPPPPVEVRVPKKSALHGIVREPEIMNCGFNALIQYLSADPEFCTYLENDQGKDPVLLHFKTLFTQYQNGEHHLDVQSLRRLMGFPEDATEQLDVHEIAAKLLERLPEEMRYLISEHRQFNREDPPLINGRPAKELQSVSSYSMIPLYPSDDGECELKTLLQNFFNSRSPLEDGQGRRFLSDDTRTIIKANHSLHLQIMRFKGRNKQRTKVILPPQIKIPVDGKEVTYALASYIIHQGNTAKSGHYIAGKVVDNKEYIINDDAVDLLENSTESSNQAYLVCYTKISD